MRAIRCTGHDLLFHNSNLKISWYDYRSFGVSLQEKYSIFKDDYKKSQLNITASPYWLIDTKITYFH